VKENNETLEAIPFSILGDLQSHSFTRIFEDQKKCLFLAENRNNLIILEKKGDQYALRKRSQDVGDIKAFWEDVTSTRIWMAGSRGLYLYDTENDSLRLLTLEKEGIPNDSYVSVVGYNNELWLGGDQGLIRYLPDSLTYKRYTVADGLLSMQFNQNAFYQEKNGDIWMGSPGGINLIHPGQVKPLPDPPQIQFTRLFIDDVEQKSMYDAGKDTMIQVGEIQNLELDFDQNTLSFEFVAIEYSDPLRNQLEYRLLGYEKKWVSIPSDRKGFVRYPNLPANSYTLQIRAANSDGVWSTTPKELPILISPPFWATWWFRGLAIIIIIAAVWGLYRQQLNRRLAKAEAERLRELDQFKNRLYTNITHEFRTPLTVIMGMAEEIKEDEKIRSLIYRNSQELLKLINQMMDLSKLESGQMKLQSIPVNVIPFLTYVAESFQSFAEINQVRLKTISDCEELIMNIDEEKLQHILTNLISNAIKFSPEGTVVEVYFSQIQKEGKDYFQVEVKDEGPGIEKEHLPYIFDRFYQADNSATRKQAGTGIGLALTRELIKLMKGEIQVESEVGKGSIFRVRLPILKAEEGDVKSREFVPAFHPEPAISTPGTEETSKELTDAPILLIIEDNRDIVSYIQMCLEDQYQIKVAANGQEGIDLAIEIVPDIIISDVMMPEKNGFEVCEILKQDERTSHIPIILLTALASEEDKITGLRQGADAYLNKPFNKEELLIRLEKLRELRKQLQAYYSLAAKDALPPSDNHPIENAFLTRLKDFVEANLDNSELEVPQLCEAVNLSHTQVYRKLKALTDQTPSQFIRSIRLQKGMELIQTTDLTIAEVAYDVGFNDPNYFTRMFTKEFGTNPSDIRN
ncbi:MAG: response regulator, partial [Bacteroidetes bacterium]|nr:response regulator [Bacteroidota bacterium]